MSWSMNSMPPGLPTPSSAPSELPRGCATPPGNGLVRVVVGKYCPWRHERVLAVAHLAVVGRAHELVVPRRPVDAVAGADDRLRVHRVDHADARRELHRRLVALLGRGAVDAGIDEAAAHRIAIDDGVAEGAARVQRAVEGHREAILLFTKTVLVLDADAAVDRQFRPDAEVVLEVGAVVAGEVVGRLRHQDAAQVARVARGVAEDHARQVVARRVGARYAVDVRVGRGVAAVEVEVAGAARERLRVDADGAVVDTQLHGVAAEQARGRGVGAPRVEVAIGGVDGARVA